MAKSIDKAQAEKILLAAFRARCVKKDEVSANIKLVIDGTHKTYKYILVTALLAKSTNENIEPLALQAGAPFDGAYDARSLCHNVLVPFERDFLEKALGGSNEPFLNKPARNTHLDLSNPVRKGRDRDTLERVINVLNAIKTAKEAKLYLSCALEYLNQKITTNKELNDSKINYNPTLIEIYEFIYRFLEKSYEGEVPVVVVGTLEKIYHRRFSKEFKVIVHKVNQSGASSKEVGDIDIYKEGSFNYAIEVKDKRFTTYDLGHALNKIRENGGKKGQFTYGLNATFDKVDIEEKINTFEEAGFMVLFQDILTYARVMLFKIDLSSKQEFTETLVEVAKEINSKDEVKIWIQDLLRELKWK